MKTSRLNEPHILSILKRHKSSISVADLCREHEIIGKLLQRTLKYGGVNASLMNKMKALRAELG